MKKHLPHHSLYFLLGLAIKGFLVLLYGFLVGCVLLIPFIGPHWAYGLLSTVFPWFAKGALTLVCGTAVVSVVENI